MAIQIDEQQGGKLMTVLLTGKLTGEDYEKFVPEVDRAIQECGKIRILVDMRDFHGWSAGALWEDTKFTLRHFSSIERLAIVGERRWHKGMATFCRPFTKADVRYFDRQHIDEANAWMELEVAVTK